MKGNILIRLFAKADIPHADVVSATTKRKTDRELILEILKSGKAITTLEARAMGIQAVATRVWELRHKKGYEIQTELIRAKSGEKYARYSMNAHTL